MYILFAHPRESIDIGKNNIITVKHDMHLFLAQQCIKEGHVEHLIWQNMCRVAASNWSGEGSFLFTSSTAVYDCNDNGSCGEV